MKKLIAAIAICGLSVSLAHAQSDWVGLGVTGGAVTIANLHDADVPMLGLDVKSAGGFLKANGAGPFTITLLDTPGNAVVGNLGNAYTLAMGATVATEIAYSGPADSKNDVAADLAGTTWGFGTEPTPVVFEVDTIKLGDPIFAPGDGIWGGQSDGTNFVVGVEGTAGDTNNWPGAEGPEHNIDGVGQKYLNFGKEGTGFIVTPANGPRSIADGIQFWAANDAEERDPASYELWGTNVTPSGAAEYPLSAFTAIAVGEIALPSSRNAGGDAELLAENSVVATFADNTDAFSSYLVLFPTLKDAAAANSMQIAEVQVYGAIVPEPSSSLLALLVLPLALLMRRRRR